MTIVLRDDENFQGSDSSDWVTVVGNLAMVRGGDGDDWISAAVVADNPETSLYGEDGDDRLSAVLSIADHVDEDAFGEENHPRSIAFLSGGDGNDVVEVAFDDYRAFYAAEVLGGRGNDTISYSGIGDQLIGTETSIDGGAGNDAINIHLLQEDSGQAFFKDPSTVEVLGNNGDDDISTYLRVSTTDAATLVQGGTGNDTITADTSAWGDGGGDAQSEAQGGKGDDAISLFSNAYGYGSKNVAFGDGGDDTVLGDSDGTNDLHGGEGDDSVTALIEQQTGPESTPGDAVNTVYGDAGDDRLSATIKLTGVEPTSGTFRSELYGGEGNDRLKVSGGDGNFLTGNQGNDTLLGSSGADRLIGGQGNDYLKGYGGVDSFEFQSARNGERDRIADFAIGDDAIDVSRIDANAFRGGNQAFSFRTHEGTGRLWIEDFGTKSILHADTGKAILDIVLEDGRVVHANDYSTGDFIL